MGNVRDLPFEEKVKYFKALLSNSDITNEEDILNIYRLINSYNTFDDDFFTNEASYIKNIAEFIDLKTELETELQGFIQNLVTWYLSLLTSCNIPLTVDQDNDKEVIPATIYGIMVISSLPLMSSLMNRTDLTKINMGNLYKVKNGFMVINRLFGNHAILGNFLEKM